MAALVLLVAGGVTSAILFLTVVKPIQRMEEGARTPLAAGGGFDPVEWPADDEEGRLARSLNDAAGKLRRDITSEANRRRHSGRRICSLFRCRRVIELWAR